MSIPQVSSKPWKLATDSCLTSKLSIELCIFNSENISAFGYKITISSVSISKTFFA
ncbi:hypothetical protein P3G55_14600 [Leptospira sp. 96542]|nr:hypothetical protein [Leptospira sp. 96542]